MSDILEYEETDGRDVITDVKEQPQEQEENLSEFGTREIHSEQNISAYVDSRIGGRRENQDSAGFQDTPLGAVIVVCDGMGGTNGGRIASAIAVSTILEVTSSASQPNPDRKEILRKAIKEANARILAYGKEHSAVAGMGTTVTALIVSEESAVAAFIGDSRIYQLRGGSKVFRTFDHSMVFEMVRRKALTEEQARLSAQSNVILKALGVSEDVEPDIFELPYLKNDRFILCSDGFWGAMPEEDFIRMVSPQTSADKVLAESMAEVDRIGRAAGGKHDNLTAAFVDMKQNSKLKEKMNTTAKIIIAALSACLLVSLLFNILPDKEKEEQQAQRPTAGGNGTNGDTPEEEDQNALFTVWNSFDVPPTWEKSYKLQQQNDTLLILFVTQYAKDYIDKNTGAHRVDTVKFAPCEPEAK